MDSPIDEKTELWVGICNKDEQALRQLMNELTPTVYGIVSAIIRPMYGEEEDALEITNSVFFTIWLKTTHYYDPNKAPYPVWIKSLARNAAIEFFRKNGRRRKIAATVAFDAEWEQHQPSIDPPVETTVDNKLIVEEIFQKLKNDRLFSDKELLVFSMKLDGRSIQEISEDLNILQPSVRRIIHTVRNKLKNLF